MAFDIESKEVMEKKFRMESSIRTHLLELKHGGKDTTCPYPSDSEQAKVWHEQLKLIDMEERQVSPSSHEAD